MSSVLRFLWRAVQGSNRFVLLSVAIFSCFLGIVSQSNVCDVKRVEFKLKYFEKNQWETEAAVSADPGVAEAPIALNRSTQKYLKILTDQLRSKLSVFAGEKIWNTRVQELEKLTTSQAWVDHAYVQRVFPNRVIVSIWTKKPMLAFVKTNGQVIPIASDASMLPTISAYHAPDLPILRDSHFLSDSVLRKNTVQMVLSFPEAGAISRASIAEIGIVNGSQLWLSLIDQNFVVRMTPTNTPLKIARVTKVLEYLHSKNLSARLIDADFSQKVLVKLRH